MWELDHKEGWAPKNWCFGTVVLEKTLESPLDCKEVQPVHPKGDQSSIFIGRTDAEAEAPILWPPDGKSRLIRKDLDAGKGWGQEENGLREDEMVGWHQQLNGHEFEQARGDGEGRGSLVCCSLCAVLFLVAQSCLTLCNPLGCSPPGSSVHGDSPGRNTGVGCYSLLQIIFPTKGLNPGLLGLYGLSHQGSPRILEWVAFLSPGDLSNPGIKPGSPALQVDSLPAELPGKPSATVYGSQRFGRDWMTEQ